jgi:hypothetical protein
MTGITETTEIADSKYVGACAAGTKPGDIISEDGNVTHTWKH